MTFDEIVKQIMLGEKIYNLPLRVCYYCRVSTDSDVQLNSLENQKKYYEKYIKSKKNWTFVGGYIDEGISGVRVDKRTCFKKMIRDSKQNKFDLIITKEVSRFARDLEDSIHYIRELKESNVGVFFENQNLNTFDPNSELILNIMFNLAQDESRKLSSRVKFGHRQAVERGHVLGSSNITGYRKEKCKLVIVEEEAKFIRKLFELYATGEYGFYKLSKKLAELGYFNLKGRLYDKDTLKRMIENPKYKGFYRARVHEVIDYRTKKRITNSKNEQVIYKCNDGSIPAIVSEELWERANNILKNRTASYKNNDYWSGGVKYSLSSKLYCKDCNANYQRSHGSRRKNRPTWSCGMYLKFRVKECESPIIAEVDLFNIFKNIMNKVIPGKDVIVNNLLKMYENIDSTNEYERELCQIDEKIKKVEEKKSQALSLVFDGTLTKEELKVQFNEFAIELEKLNNNKKEILIQVDSLNNSQNSLEKMSKLIQEEIDGGSLDEFIRKFVDEVIISKIGNDRYNIKMDIYLNLLGEEKVKIKGARHINGPAENDALYLENQQCETLEVKRGIHHPNKFTYNVYIDSL